MATAAKFVQPIAIFLAYLIQLDVDVTGNITAKLCEVGSEVNIFCSLVPMVVWVRVDFFQNGCRCHGNGQNAKKLKNTKMIIVGYSPNKN
jgi:hypothetical protein